MSQNKELWGIQARWEDSGEMGGRRQVGGGERDWGEKECGTAGEMGQDMVDGGRSYEGFREVG